MKNKLIFLLIFFNILQLVAKDPDKNEKAGAKTLIAKNLKLIVWDNSGRFNLFSNINDRWYPLFFDDYPSTNIIRFYVDNRTLDFGMGGFNNTSTCEIIEDHIIYKWNNNEIEITLDYNLIRIDSEQFDTLHLKVLISNLTNRTMNVSGLFCFDSYIGESSNIHYTLPGNMQINSETEFEHNTIPSYITTLSSTPEQIIKFHFDNSVSNRPSRIFMANWKKVTEKSISYSVKEGADFNWGRFSFNDSALFVEYKNIQLERGSNAERVFIIQNKNISTITQNTDVVETIKAIKKTDIPIAKNDKVKVNSHKEMPDDLDGLSIEQLFALLDIINKKLDAGVDIKQEDIDYADRIINAIENK